ncbi:phosphorylase family protein [Inconstantimicrobium porci]|nr:phosphorylase [Inconstantimicrobium porci]
MNKVQEILKEAKKYNGSQDMLKDVYGIDSNTKYDAVVVAPVWTPEKIFKNQEVRIKNMIQYANQSSYEVEFAGKKIAWIMCGVGSCNLVDVMLCLADSAAEKIIFVGSVGALKSDIKLGELSTPIESYAYESATMYLFDSLDKNNFGCKIVPQNMEYINKVIKKAEDQEINMVKRKVFCTDSLFCEYKFLDYIKNTGAELIEMETASFYKAINMMNKKGIALLCVSDNSAANISLVARDEESTFNYHNSREVNIPKLINMICEME